jgi:uncharacterized membrane protein
MMKTHIQERRFPVAAGVFFGLGLGGFFDGVVCIGLFLLWRSAHRHIGSLNC